MMDIVIPLGTGSMHNNIELKFCLHAIEKHLKGWYNIFIVGDHPRFDGNFIHMPVQEKSGPMYNKERRIMEKIYSACADETISENFLMMNDDHFIIKDIHVKDIRPYYCGTLKEAIGRKMKNGCYRMALANTEKALLDRGRPVLHYDIHMPMVYNKSAFQYIMGKYDWTIKCGYVIKSLYANSTEIKGEECPDMMIGWGCETKEDILKLIKDRWVFAINSNGLNAVMEDFLTATYQ